MPVRTTLDHVTIVTDDFEASRPVYDAVLGSLGLSPTVDYEDPEGEEDDPDTVAALGYAYPDERPMLWLAAGLKATIGAHLALGVTDPDLVRAAHRDGVAAGAVVVQAPRDWESVQLGYYGVQFADPAGNVIEVVVRA